MLFGFVLFSLLLALFSPYGLIPSICGAVAGIGAFGLALTVDLRHIEYLFYIAVPTSTGGIMGLALFSAIPKDEFFVMICATAFAGICFVGSMIGARKSGIPQSWSNYQWREPETGNNDQEISAE